MPRKRRLHSWLGSLYRAALHFPVGAFSAWLIFVHPVHGILLCVGWLAYEVLEDWRLADRSYLDVAGFLWGFGVTGAVFTYLFAFGVTSPYFEFLWR